MDDDAVDTLALNNLLKGGQNSGTITGATWNQSDVDNNGKRSLVYTKNGEVVDCGSLPIDGKSEFSILCWFKPASSMNNNGLLAQRRNASGNPWPWEFVIRSGNRPTAQVNTTTASPSVAATTGLSNFTKWYCCGFSFRANDELAVYMDGVKEGSVATDGGLLQNPNDHPLWLGQHYDNRFSVDGLLDTVEMFNRALTESEFANIYAAGRTGLPQTLYLPGEVASYLPSKETRFRNSTTLNDRVGANQMTIINGTWTTTGLDFNAAGDAECDAPLSGPPFSMSSWFFNRSTNATRTVMSLSGRPAGRQWHWLWVSTSDNSVNFQQRQAGTTINVNGLPGSAPLNTWVHVAAVVESNSSRKLYINGELAAEDLTSTVNVADIDAFNLGAYYGNDQDVLLGRWDGILNDSRLFHRALTPAEVRFLASSQGVEPSYNRIFGGGTHSEDAAVLANFELQETSGTAIADSSSNARSWTASRDASLMTAAGPNTWLPNSLAFNGSDQVADSASNAAFDTLETSLLAFVTAGAIASDNVIAGKSSGTSGYRLHATTGETKFSVNDPAANSANGNALSIGSTFHHVAGSYDEITNRVWVDGVEAEAADAGPISHAAVAAAIGAGTGLTSWTGSIAGSAWLSRAIARSEALEHRDGPEPHSTAIPTLSISETLWTGTLGTWNDPTNGDVSYVWELIDENDLLVESGFGSSPNGSGTYSGSYYLRVWASNASQYAEYADSVLTPVGGAGEDVDLVADAGVSESVPLEPVPDITTVGNVELTADAGVSESVPLEPVPDITTVGEVVLTVQAGVSESVPIEPVLDVTQLQDVTLVVQVGVSESVGVTPSPQITSPISETGFAAIVHPF